MLFVDKLDTAGEYPFVFSGKAGQLEGVLTVPPSRNTNYVAFLGHPHSLQGGSMTNKVVTTMARAFKELAIPSLRFNFRGVGLSQGRFDEGVGESEDMLLLTQLWKEEQPHTRSLFAGFSFGSYVTYRAAAQSEHDLLISVAPPVHHYDYQAFQPSPAIWHILQGEEDEVVPVDLVLNFAKHHQPPIPVSLFPETGHFFHSKLIDLKMELIRILQERVLNQ